MKTTIAALALAVLAIELAGCGNSLEDPYTVSGSTAWVKVSALTSPSVTSVSLVIDLQQRPGRGCPVLTERAKATINGQPVAFSPGSGNQTSYDPTVWCSPPRLYTNVPTAPGPTTIVISDDTGEIRVTADLMSQRTWSVIAEGQSDFRIGDTVRVRWSNPADALVAGEFEATWEPDVVAEYYAQRTATTEDVTASSDELSFTIPAEWAFATGTGQLNIAATARLQPTECQGALSCDVTFSSASRQPIMLSR